MANESIGILLDRFLEDELFFDYVLYLFYLDSEVG